MKYSNRFRKYKSNMTGERWISIEQKMLFKAKDKLQPLQIIKVAASTTLETTLKALAPRCPNLIDQR
jgi:hypothetical protein